MGQVAVTVNGRSYDVACDDGQEEHVTRLAAYIDKRAEEIAKTVGAVGEGRLLVMTSLLVADELADAYDEVEKLQDQVKEAGEAVKAEAEARIEARFAPIVDGIAVRIENIAAHIDGD